MVANPRRQATGTQGILKAGERVLPGRELQLLIQSQLDVASLPPSHLQECKFIVSVGTYA